MYQRIVAVCAAGLVTAAVSVVSADQQAPPNPTQQIVVTDGDTPLFRVTVVGRSVPAVNYRPRNGETRVDFTGTALAPKAEGWAKVEGERGVIRIESEFDDLPAQQSFGPEYLTYVLWAVTPEGRASNLGELQVNDDDGKLKTTTELQAFAMMVTAEPYFAVTQPSDVVVVENLVRDGGFERTRGRVETVQAKVELLTRGAYLMNHTPGSVNLRPVQPGAPLDLAQARNAVTLARLAGADAHAPETFAKASALLAEAEAQRERGRRGNEVQQPARQAVQTAEDARLIALQRQEELYLAEQRRLAAEREEAARQQAAAEAQRAREEAERARLETERRRQAELERAQADAARTAALEQQALAEQARLAAERERLAAEQAKAEAERVRAEAEAARLAAEQQAAAARAQAEQAEADRQALRDQLRQQLNVILETRETARGLIVNLSDVLFDVDRANLKPGAREKLARIAGILSAHPGLEIEIEGHTDSTGSDDYNQRLSERRAQSVQAYLAEQGIGQAIVSTVGFGESRPVATNGTAEGRQQNRRVEIIVSGEAIGTEP